VAGQQLVPVEGEVAIPVPVGDLVGAQAEHPREVDPEQEDQRASGADVHGQGVVAEAAFKVAHLLGLVGEPGRTSYLARRYGDVGNETPVNGPGEEEPDAVPAGRPASQPPVDVVLPQHGQGQPVSVELAEQVERDSDLAADAGRGVCGERPAALRSPPGPVQHVPVGVGPHQSSVRLGSGGQRLLQPRRDAFQVLQTLGKDLGLDQHLAHIVDILIDRQGVEQLVGDGLALRGQAGQELSGRAFAQPDHDAARFLRGCRRGGERLALDGDLTGGAAEHVAEPVGDHAAEAPSGRVDPSGLPAGAAQVVDRGAGARARRCADRSRRR